MLLLVRHPRTGGFSLNYREVDSVRAVKLPNESRPFYEARQGDGPWCLFTKKENPNFRVILRQDETWTKELVTHQCGIRYRRAMYKYISPTISFKGAA